MVTTIMAKREPKESIKYPLSIEKGLYERVYNLAESRGISLAGLIRMLLLAELAKETPDTSAPSDRRS